MKKYKLLKVYPSLNNTWVVGMEVGQGDRKGSFADFSPCSSEFKDIKINFSEVMNNPDFWEAEKEYEILSFKGIETNSFYESLGNNIYGNKALHQPFNLSTLLKGNYKIHSVKRLFDGEVFTVGDKVLLLGYNTPNTIKDFAINNNLLYINDVRLSSVKVYKKPLFKTEDGVEIFEGDRCYGGHLKVGIDDFCKSAWVGDSILMKYFSTKEAALECIKRNSASFITEDKVEIFEGDDYFELLNFKKIFKVKLEKNKILTGKNSRKVFSTKEAAEEYILMNKPCLSLNDIDEMYDNTSAYRFEQMAYLKNTIKTKL
jgi:hypothetical protein